MEHENRSIENRLRSFRSTSATSVAGALVLVAILTMTPTSAAGRAGSNLGAPYTGTTGNAQASLQSNCGSAGGHATKWMPTSGKITGSARATARGCPIQFGSGYGAATRTESVAFPFFLRLAGYYNASVSYKYKLSDAFAESPGSCPTATNYSGGYDDIQCYWQGSWLMYVSVALFDLTNQSYVGATDGSQEFENYTVSSYDSTCAYGVCSTVVGGSASGSSAYDYSYESPGSDYSLSFVPAGTFSGVGKITTNSTSWDPGTGTGMNYTLSPLHAYEIIVTAFFFAYGDVYGYADSYTGTTYSSGYVDAGGTAGGSVAGTSGNGVTITSVTLARVT